MTQINLYHLEALSHLEQQFASFKFKVGSMRCYQYVLRPWMAITN